MVLGLFPLFPLLSFSQRSLEPSSLCEMHMAGSQNSRVFERSPTAHLLLVLKTEGGCDGKMVGSGWRRERKCSWWEECYDEGCCKRVAKCRWAVWLKALDCCGDAVWIKHLIQRSGLVVRTKETYNTVQLVLLFSGEFRHAGGWTVSWIFVALKVFFFFFFIDVQSYLEMLDDDHISLKM